jgi:hypothetical protein
MKMKKQREKIDPFSVKWIDQVHDNILEAKKVFNNVLKGIRDEDELKEGRRQLERAYQITDQVWDALREAMNEKTNCLREFNRWKSENCAGVLMLLDEKLRKEYLPMFEAMVKEWKAA